MFKIYGHVLGCRNNIRALCEFSLQQQQLTTPTLLPEAIKYNELFSALVDTLFQFSLVWKKKISFVFAKIKPQKKRSNTQVLGMKNYQIISGIILIENYYDVYTENNE